MSTPNPVPYTFTLAQKVDLRRFLGYSIYGAAPSPMNGYRFLTEYGFLEWKLLNCSAEEAAVVLTTFLPTLYRYEQGIVKASENLDTDRAAVWYHNKNEVLDRTNLFNSKRRELAAFLGVPLMGATSSRHSASLVV